MGLPPRGPGGLEEACPEGGLQPSVPDTLFRLGRGQPFLGRAVCPSLAASAKSTKTTRDPMQKRGLDKRGLVGLHPPI